MSDENHSKEGHATDASPNSFHTRPSIASTASRADSSLTTANIATKKAMPDVDSDLEAFVAGDKVR
jgi:hypothetical protein